MRTNMEVFGKGVNVTPIPKEICEERIHLLTERLNVLFEPHYTKRDNLKINTVHKDLLFWKEMRDNEVN